MRQLILMRGSPGCGKTTWIRHKGLTDYTLSADAIRAMFASPVLKPDGGLAISQKNDKAVWSMLFQMLENRMQQGDFTVIDACNSKTSEMKHYKALADSYRYRVYCVDMTGVPIEEAKRRNRERDPVDFVPDEYIDRVYSRFETQQIPSGITCVKPEDFDSVFMQPFDLSEYDKVVHIGDIHGCYDALQKIFGEDPVTGIDPNTAYIFLGDYIDRGPNTPDVLRFLMQIAQYKNVCLLEGNHERHLWTWANDKRSPSREFEFKTKLQLEAAGISKAEVRKFYRKLRQCSWYTWRGQSVLCTHGGVANLSMLPKMDFLPSRQMIHGVGQYEDFESCADSFEGFDGIDWQVFGHRNINGAKAMVRPHSILLENAVELGGTLRTATLTEGVSEGVTEGVWQFAEYTSDLAIAAQAKAAEEVSSVPSSESEIIQQLVGQMRCSKLISEKRFGHISSFNFTREAFNKRDWNDLTVRARGLYIDTANNKIAARGYEKFFKVNEREETSLASLARTFAYPIEVYVKENGFLGLLSLDRSTDELFATTKSSVDGDMAQLFRQMLTDDMKKAAREYLKEHDATLLFEVIHPQLDPHIIEYSEPGLYLLDIVDNTLGFHAADYSEVTKLASAMGVHAKERCSNIHNWDGFMKLYNWANEMDSSIDKPLEGFVLRDANGFMVKLKTAYYDTWKKMRGVADKVYRYGHLQNTALLSTPLMNHFYAFVKQYYSKENGAEPEHRSIIELRNMFEKSHGG